MINISSSSHNYEIIEKNIKSCVSKGWIGIGDHTKDFEEKFSKRINRKFITVNNGTNALHLGLHLLDLKEGIDLLEVLLEQLKFPATPGRLPVWKG